MKHEFQNIIELKNLKAGYLSKKEDIALIDNANLELKSAEIIALLGKNGSGKSTLLKTICNLLPKIDGTIIVNEKELSNYKTTELAKIVSYVSTEKIFAPDLKVFDILSFGAYQYSNWLGIIDKNSSDKIEQIIDLLKISHIQNRFYHTLSDGEKQKTMIGRALCQNTQIIILDEPTAFLDINNKLEILNLLKMLCYEHNKSIIFSSHDFSNVMKEADKIWFLDNKEITEGAPEDLVLNNFFESKYNSDSVKFCPETANILYNRKYSKTIGLIAYGELKTWTKAALERINFNVICNKTDSVNVVVNIENNYPIWSYSEADKIEKFNSIYDLINNLKHKKL
ncbi:MAG: hypothetical protein A2046_09470 [Bacteroidetes bacterium GWA2_30_7]|nr:MAG: hypothetical protein A2046_09470 [Bacteroidetes bacterium GWA2_30_7]